MKNTETDKREKKKLLPSDFYINEEGLMVFTEEYHTKRGRCCGNYCKHCPFFPKSQKGNTVLKNNIT